MDSAYAWFGTRPVQHLLLAERLEFMCLALKGALQRSTLLCSPWLDLPREGTAPIGTAGFVDVTPSIDLEEARYMMLTICNDAGSLRTPLPACQKNGVHQCTLQALPKCRLNVIRRVSSLSYV